MRCRQLDIAESVGHLAGRGMLGHVEIGYVASVAFSGLLSLAMLTFRKERPGVVLHGSRRWKRFSNSRPSREGKLDVGFIRPRPNYPEGVVVEVLLTEKLLLALPVGHPQSAAPRSVRSPTKPLWCLSPAASPSMPPTSMAAAGPTPERVVQVRDFLSAITLVGAGCRDRTRARIPRALAMPNVRYSEMSNYDRRVDLALAYRSARNSPVVQAFVEVCRSCRNVSHQA